MVYYRVLKEMSRGNDLNSWCFNCDVRCDVYLKFGNVVLCWLVY